MDVVPLVTIVDSPVLVLYSFPSVPPLLAGSWIRYQSAPSGEGLGLRRSTLSYLPKAKNRNRGTWIPNHKRAYFYPTYLTFLFIRHNSAHTLRRSADKSR